MYGERNVLLTVRILSHVYVPTPRSCRVSARACACRVSDGRAECARALHRHMESTLEWLRDRKRVRAHLMAHDLPARLARGRGFARVTPALPRSVALDCSALLSSSSAWEVMDDGEVVGRSDSIEHRFAYSEVDDQPEALRLLADALGSAFDGVVPGVVPSFSYAKYGAGDWIAPHDDKAHVRVGRRIHSRKFAGLLYLSPVWRAEWGGALLDLEGGSARSRAPRPREIVPAFNSLVLFEVPRMHAVAPVHVQNPPRLSLFGWWLAPGKLYKLDTSEHAVKAVQQGEVQGVMGGEGGVGGESGEGGECEYADVAAILAAQEAARGLQCTRASEERRGNASGSVNRAKSVKSLRNKERARASAQTRKEASDAGPRAVRQRR